MFEITKSRKALAGRTGSYVTGAVVAATVLTSLLPGAVLAQTTKTKSKTKTKTSDPSIAIQNYRRQIHLQNQVDYLYAIRALQQKGKMPQAANLGIGNAVKSKTATRAVDIGQTSGKWVLRGPFRMTPPYANDSILIGNGVGYNPRALGYPISYISGRANAVAIDGTSKNGLTGYLATAGGGVWKTLDGGVNWQPSGTSTFPIQQTSSVAVNPKNGLVVFVGLGDFNDNTNGYGFGTGIMRTSNGGSTWVNVGSAQMQGTAVSAIAIDPGNPQIVMATCGRGTRVGGVYRSVDGGNTYAAVTGAPTGDWSDIEIGIPDTGGVSHYYATRVGDGVYRSDDQGANWTKLPVPLVTIGGGGSNLDVAVSPLDPKSVTVLEASQSFADARVYKSADMGATWREITGDLLINSANSDGGNNWITSYRAMVLRSFPAPQANPLAPSTEDLTYAGGRTLSSALGPGAELDWTDIGLSLDSQSKTHAEQQDIAQNPLQKNKFLVVNDGGIYGLNYSASGTPNRAGSWDFLGFGSQFYNATLSISQFVTADFARDNPSRMMGGTLNNGVAKSEGAFSINSTLTWAAITNDIPYKYYPGYPNHPMFYKLISFEDYGGAVAFNPNNSNISYTYTPGGGNWPNTKLFFTQDNWQSSLDISPDQRLKDPNRVPTNADAVDANGAALYYTYPYLPLASSSLASDWIADQRTALGVLTVASNNVLYTGGQYLWRYDAGIAENLPSAPTDPAKAYPANGRWRSKIGNTQFTSSGSISAITVNPAGGELYLGTTDGQVWVSNPNTLNMFDATSGASKATFTKISGPTLPSRPVTSISINTNPNDAGVPNADIVVTLGGIAAGSEGHVYRAADVRASTPLFTKQDGLGTASLPNVAVNAIDRDPDDVVNTWYVATDLGVFTTINGGSSWSDASTPLGLPNVECTTLKVIKYSGTDKRLNVATMGRGFFQFDLGNAAVVAAPPTLLVSPAYSRAGSQVIVTLNVRNSGGTATNAAVAAATLTVGTTNFSTLTTLPASLGSIGNNDNKAATFAFPGSIGRLGTSAVLNATITYRDANGNAQTFVYTSPRTRLP